MRLRILPRPSPLFVSALLATALVAQSLAAQGGVSSRPVAVIVSGGATVPLGGFKDYNELGVHADVSVLIRLAGQSIRLRPEFTYGRFSLKDRLTAVQLTAASYSSFARPSTVIPSYGGSGDVSTLLGLLGNVELPLASGLYVIVGVGATNVKSGATESLEDFSQTALTYNGGAGLRFHLGALSGFVEGRVKSITVEKGKALFSDVRTIPVSFGIVF